MRRHVLLTLAVATAVLAAGPGQGQGPAPGSSGGVDVAGAAPPAVDATGKMLVYTGNGAIIIGFTRFASAVGKTLESLSTLPADLTPWDCVVASTNTQAFTAGQLDAFRAYLDAGGRLFALAEYRGYAGGAPVTVMNGLAAGLGSAMAVQAADLDFGFHTTTDIAATPLTSGVSSIRYAATSRVTVAGDAEALVRTAGGELFLAAEFLRGGVFVLAGDSNVWSDFSSDGYSAHGNGVLAANLCRGVPTKLEAKPFVAQAPPPAVYAPNVVAVLTTEAGVPVPGQTVAFTAGGSPVCSAPTNATGHASCTAVGSLAQVVLGRGYAAAFAGSLVYGASNDTAPLLEVQGQALP